MQHINLLDCKGWSFGDDVSASSELLYDHRCAAFTSLQEALLGLIAVWHHFAHNSVKLSIEIEGREGNRVLGGHKLTA